MRYMIGYHYTSLENYQKIRYEGLVPYRWNHYESVNNLLTTVGQSCSPLGIWVYKQRQRGISHFGCIFWQMDKKRCNDVVLLKVRYSKEDSISHLKPKYVDLTHDLNLGSWYLHTDVPADIVFKHIPADRIQLIGQYNLVKYADRRQRC